MVGYDDIAFNPTAAPANAAARLRGVGSGGALAGLAQCAAIAIANSNLTAVIAAEIPTITESAESAASSLDNFRPWVSAYDLVGFAVAALTLWQTAVVTGAIARRERNRANRTGAFLDRNPWVFDVLHKLLIGLTFARHLVNHAWSLIFVCFLLSVRESSYSQYDVSPLRLAERRK